MFSEVARFGAYRNRLRFFLRGGKLYRENKNVPTERDVQRKTPFSLPPIKMHSSPSPQNEPPPTPQDFQLKHSLKCYELNKYLQGFVVPTRVHSWQLQQENPKTNEIPLHITGNR